jgi:hypothetical protein
MGSCFSGKFKPNDVQIKKFVAIIQTRTNEFNNVSPKIVKYFKEQDRYRLNSMIKKHSDINEKDVYTYLYSLEYHEASNTYRVNHDKLEAANDYPTDLIHNAWIIGDTLNKQYQRNYVPSDPVPDYRGPSSTPMMYSTTSYGYPAVPPLANNPYQYNYDSSRSYYG